LFQSSKDRCSIADDVSVGGNSSIILCPVYYPVLLCDGKKLKHFDKILLKIARITVVIS
jgi:hypothetical protein